MKTMVTIIGAGAIGSAIGNLIDQTKVSLNYLDKNEELVRYSSDVLDKNFNNSLEQSDIIFICIPSKHVRELCENMNLKENTIVICLAKGMEEGTLYTMDFLLDELLPGTKNGLMYGPMLAKEMEGGQPGFAHLAIDDYKAFEKVNFVFKKAGLCLTYSSEVHSIALAGVLKNIYALAIGIADGLEYGNNLKGWLVALAFKEMRAIIKEIGKLNEEVEYSFLSDFITTAFSSDSRNHLAGEMMGRESKLLVSEGTISILSIRTIVGSGTFHLLNALEEIFIVGENARLVFENLIIGCGEEKENS